MAERGSDGAVSVKTALFTYVGSPEVGEVFEDPSVYIPGDSRIVDVVAVWGPMSSKPQNRQPHVQIQVARVIGVTPLGWIGLTSASGSDSDVTRNADETVWRPPRLHPEMLRVTENNRRLRLAVTERGNVNFQSLGYVSLTVQFVNL